MPDLAETIAKQDTTHGQKRRERLVLFADAGSNETWVIECDSSSGRRVRIFKADTAGDPIASAGSIDLNLSTLAALSITHKDAAFRVQQWKDPATCVLKQAAVLMTEPETV